MAITKTGKALTPQERKALPDTAFAISTTRKYPIHDEKHARSALSYIAQHGTESEQRVVRSKIKVKFGIPKDK